MHHDDPLIDRLAADLRPVRTQRARAGWARVLLAALATALCVHLGFGLRPAQALQPEGRWFLLVEAVLATLGVASAFAAVRMADPQRTGRRGAAWLAAGSALLPAAALGALALGAGGHASASGPGHWECAAWGTFSGLLVAIALVSWLRRGAPASPARAGLYAGIAAGALGSAIYGLSCPLTGFPHWALWHFVPVLVAGLAGYTLLPRFLRW
jgi:hypothetical protein